MEPLNFDEAFSTLTGNPPFPWQRALYERFISDRRDNIPASCNLPTGLGKTSIIAIWLIALAKDPSKMPRRLVYVVNRRTVVDQTTNEVERLRERLPNVPNVFDRLCSLCATEPTSSHVPQPLAISTLRGQFADNREWSADPSRAAVICGTVDMIGSRLLFSGYGCGFKTRPLQAGFLGQDVLLVHDEAHLEPAFQELIVAIEKEQQRCKDVRPLRVLELTATSRAGDIKPFTLGDEDYKDVTVQRRIGAKKSIQMQANTDKSKLADEIAALALKYKDTEAKPAVLVFVRKVDDVDKIIKKLPKDSFEQLTGTLRGLERDGLVKKPIFQRFLPISNRDKDVTPQSGTVYLVCTSAGEVGVNISADHLVCDLSTFESMAQRFGRVNRFGDCDNTRIDIVYPKDFEKEDLGPQLRVTLALLELLKGNGSPSSLSDLRDQAIEEASSSEAASSDCMKALRSYVAAHRGTDPRLGGFTPTPTILPASDILFDAWALTTIRDKLPGRPAVEPYLHGLAEWEQPETHVAWREEVDRIKGNLLAEYPPKDLLEDYPLKPHELLRDNSSRVFDRLKKLKAEPKTPVWVVADDDSVNVTTLEKLIDAGKEQIERMTVLLPPVAGGLNTNGMMDATSNSANDVADEWRDDAGKPRRSRIWDDDSIPAGMRRIRRIDTNPDFDEAENESASDRFWYWYESAKSGDGDGSKNTTGGVTWDTHTKDVIDNTEAIVGKLSLGELAHALIFAAKCHDLGKKRKVFQTVLGNRDYPKVELAKSGKKGGRIEEKYRHEFGSLIDTQNYESFANLNDELKAFVLHVIAAHHGRARPHFPLDEAFDPERASSTGTNVSKEVPRRFARLQRKYGRWGLAYLESLLRAADYAASANPSELLEETL